MTKDELVATLTSTRDAALTSLRAVPPLAFEQGRYENGWNAREIMAHVASIEWTYPKLIELARESGGRAPSPVGEGAQAPVASGETRRTTDTEAANIATRPAQGGILSYNDRQVEKRKDVPFADLIDEWEKNRNALIAAVEACDDELFLRTIRSAGGITGQLADVISAVANGHVQMHVADITGANWTGPRF